MERLRSMGISLFLKMKGKNGQVIRFPTCLIIFLGIATLGTADLYASQADLQLAEAKKEGRVVYYSTSNLPDTTTLAKAFEAKYPEIRVEIFRSGRQGIVSRITNEHRARKYIFDAVSVSPQLLITFKEAGIIGKYISSELKEYPPAFKDTEGYWAGIYESVYVIAYNRNLVSPRELPKTYEDLANPKWRGKMMKDRTVPFWLGFMIQQMGREKALDLMQKLAANDIIYREGANLVVDLVVAGEVPLGFPLKGDAIEEKKLMGAPVDWIRPEPVLAFQNGIGVSSKPPHPNATKLFVDFVLSQGGQETIAKTGRIPTRPGVKHHYPNLTDGFLLRKYEFYPTKDYEELSRLYLSIFKTKR